MSSDPKTPDIDTALVSAGHDPSRHLGSVKPPIYETSVFAFRTAGEGKRFFEVTYGLDERLEDEELGFIYSRLDGPNLRAVEPKLAALEGSDDALVFNSGMAAINTVFLSFLRPGDVVIYSSPLYGGTSKVLEGLYTELGIDVRPFTSHADDDDLEGLVDDGPLSMVYVETPSNPTNDIFDMAMASRIARAHDARLVVDNTFLTPIWQRPLEHGADLVVHSATKYLAGHSDITAGAVCGGAEDMDLLRHNRYRIGTTPSASTAWMLGRSLETLRLRVEQQTRNATAVAAFLSDHPKVSAVNHLSLLDRDDRRLEVYRRQCLGPGAMIAFEVTGGEEGAFKLLDGMRLVHLAVSLGGTESLASHPWTMSHSTVAPDDKMRIGVTPGLIRLSVGLESAEDLIADLTDALEGV